jgi:hypothetical protein
MNLVYLPVALCIGSLVPAAASALTVREPAVAHTGLTEPFSGDALHSVGQKHREGYAEGLLVQDAGVTAIPLGSLALENTRLTPEENPVSQLSPVCDIPDGPVCRGLGGPWEGDGPVADEATTAPTPVPSDTFTFQLGLFIVGALLLTIRRSPEYRAWYDSIFGPLVDY